MPDARSYNLPARSTAVRLFKLGHLTISEAAELAGVSRQAVRAWALDAGINPLRTRERYLRRLWRSSGSKAA